MHFHFLFTTILFSFALSLPLSVPDDNLVTRNSGCITTKDKDMTCSSESHKHGDTALAGTLPGSKAEIRSARRIFQDITAIRKPPATGSNLKPQIRSTKKRQDVGICMVGVESACNGDQWDENGEETPGFDGPPTYPEDWDEDHHDVTSGKDGEGWGYQ